MTAIPDTKWLAGEYLLPPEGKGRSCPDIGKEFGVTKHVVQKWVKKLGIWQSQSRRTSFRRKGFATWWKEPPAIKELATKYLLPPDGLGMTLHQLAEDFEVSVPTIRKWLKKYDLTQPFPERHAQRMSDEGNAAYTDGSSPNYIIRKLTKDRPKICEWCGATEKVQVHHQDHDRQNNDLDNLTWLCGPCNRLDAQLWQLKQAGRVLVTHLNRRLTIEFVQN